MIIGEIFLFLFLLILSSIFSGSETAYFSLDKKQLSSKESNEVISLLQNPKRLLIILLTGNTIVNSAMAILAALITILGIVGIALSIIDSRSTLMFIPWVGTFVILLIIGLGTLGVPVLKKLA